MLKRTVTKDFGELVGAYEIQFEAMSLLLYSGVSYSTLIRPDDIKRISTLHGFEIHTPDNFTNAFGRPLNLFLADHLSLVGIPSYIGTNNLEFGVKFGEWRGTGVRLYLSYFSGLTMFSQYYNIREDHWGLGFTFDVW